jgi:hypothetical protein
MSSAKDNAASDFKVDDPAAAFHKLEDATRRLLSTPKGAGVAPKAKAKAPGKKRRS